MENPETFTPDYRAAALSAVWGNLTFRRKGLAKSSENEKKVILEVWDSLDPPPTLDFESLCQGAQMLVEAGVLHPAWADRATLQEMVRERESRIRQMYEAQ